MFKFSPKVIVFSHFLRTSGTLCNRQYRKPDGRKPAVINFAGKDFLVPFADLGKRDASNL